jgi:chromosome segregation ATPase
MVAPSGQIERERLELESMQIENDLKRRQLDEQEARLARVMEELAASETKNTAAEEMQAVVENLRERVAVIDSAVSKIGEAMGELSGVMRDNADRAIAAISKPKRIVRERGRIARIETE